MNKPRASLAQLAPVKAGHVPAPQPVEEAKKPRIGQTLRLHAEAWQEIKELSVRLSRDRGQPVRQHELLIEAVNDLLRKYGRPAVAE